MEQPAGRRGVAGAVRVKSLHTGSLGASFQGRYEGVILHGGAPGGDPELVVTGLHGPAACPKVAVHGNGGGSGERHHPALAALALDDDGFHGRQIEVVYPHSHQFRTARGGFKHEPQDRLVAQVDEFGGLADPGTLARFQHGVDLIVGQ